MHEQLEYDKNYLYDSVKSHNATLSREWLPVIYK